MQLGVKVAVVVMVAVVLRGGVGMSAALCPPDCTGKVFMDKVINPNNCTEYYYCLGDGVATDHAVPCDAGTHFDETAADCVPNTAVPCVSPCDGSGSCHLTCNGTLDIVSDATDCSQYFLCTPAGAEGPFRCPPEHPFFDGEECGNDNTKCCSGLCEAVCEVSNTVIPDPMDCKRFYICEERGPPEETLHFTCPSGWNFNIQLGECSMDAQCTVLCNEYTIHTFKTKWRRHH